MRRKKLLEIPKDRPEIFETSELIGMCALRSIMAKAKKLLEHATANTWLT